MWLGKGAPELDGGVDHLLFFGDDLGASGHASEVMTGNAVVLLDQDGMLLADDMAIAWQDVGESLTIVGVKMQSVRCFTLS